MPMVVEYFCVKGLRVGASTSGWAGAAPEEEEKEEKEEEEEEEEKTNFGS